MNDGTCQAHSQRALVPLSSAHHSFPLAFDAAHPCLHPLGCTYSPDRHHRGYSVLAPEAEHLATTRSGSRDTRTAAAPPNPDLPRSAGRGISVRPRGVALWTDGAGQYRLSRVGRQRARHAPESDESGQERARERKGSRVDQGAGRARAGNRQLGRREAPRRLVRAWKIGRRSRVGRRHAGRGRPDSVGEVHESLADGTREAQGAGGEGRFNISLGVSTRYSFMI